ncbi:MAG: HAMP domain-containing histidine kinase [Deltaproteobacteria bacterium]|jgi:signal transduction histidine kinase|nr:HAMP domain-containing histidine kinase [Deltaproteobacteria bacterium]
MKKRTIILYWILLFVPTCIIGISAFYMIRHEQERINQEAVSSAKVRARTMADAISATVETVEDAFTESLNAIPNPLVYKTLLDWVDANPLVRNVFVWDKEKGLQYPLAGATATSEENRFIVRYEALFSGRISWQAAGSSRNEAFGSSSSDKELPGRNSSSLVQETRKFKSGRQALKDLAQGRYESEGKNLLVEAVTSVGEGGWIPWFEENRLHILGWFQKRPDSAVYGIELETMTLLSRIIADFPKEVSDGIVYAIVDGKGEILHQIGNAMIQTGTPSDQSVSLAPFLPHWQINVYMSNGMLPIESEKGFLILASLLLVIFLASIILGGLLLTRQAQRNMIDAMQKTSFVSSVSHELKTPLTSIRMYAELLEEGRIKDTEKMRRYLKVIVAESQRLTRLVNNVLDFSRLEQGRKTYHKELFNLAEYVRTILQAHRLRIREAGMNLIDEVPDEIISVELDRDGIEQVLLNLIDNALKYVTEGGELLITLKRKDKHCEISVMDRGSGIPPAHRKKIFDRFHRVDNSLTSIRPGSGLGLSISKKIMLDLGGDILYEPRPGGGSCFIVIVPCASTEAILQNPDQL